MDPRTDIIGERMKKVKRIIAVAGGKGGVGKSSIASMLSIALSRNYKVGLFDMDFHGPSDHVILGAKNLYPEEDKGILPPEVEGIKFMSITYYTGKNPSPIRGTGITQSIIELLAITRWGDLDYLILDMPPGLGDTTLDIMRLLPRAEFLVVYNPSKIVTETVGKLISLLEESKVSIIGTLENMGEGEEKISHYLGTVGYDKNFEDALGSKERLLKTGFFKDLTRVLPKIEAKR